MNQKLSLGQSVHLKILHNLCIQEARNEQGNQPFAVNLFVAVRLVLKVKH